MPWHKFKSTILQCFLSLFEIAQMIILRYKLRNFFASFGLNKFLPFSTTTTASEIQSRNRFFRTNYYFSSQFRNFSFFQTFRFSGIFLRWLRQAVQAQGQIEGACQADAFRRKENQNRNRKKTKSGSTAGQKCGSEVYSKGENSWNIFV